MHKMPKTEFSDLPAVSLALLGDIVEVQSKEKTVGYYIPVAAFRDIKRALDTCHLWFSRGETDVLIENIIAAARAWCEEGDDAA